MRLNRKMLLLISWALVGQRREQERGPRRRLPGGQGSWEGTPRRSTHIIKGKPSSIMLPMPVSRFFNSSSVVSTSDAVRLTSGLTPGLMSGVASLAAAKCGRMGETSDSIEGSGSSSCG